MRSTGGTRADMYPQTTVSGVEPKVTSGLLPTGAGCDAADVTNASAPTAAQQTRDHLESCFDIDTPFCSKRKLESRASESFPYEIRQLATTRANQENRPPFAGSLIECSMSSKP